MQQLLPPHLQLEVLPCQAHDQNEMNRLLGNEQKDSHHAKAGIQPVDIRTRQEGTLVVGTLGEDTLEEDTLEAGTHLEQTGSHVEAGTPRAEVGIHLGTRTGTPYHYAYPFHLPFFFTFFC